MAEFFGTYQTDLDRDVWGASLRSFFRVDDGALDLPDEADLIPPSLIAAMNGREGPCRLPVQPRRLVLEVSPQVRYVLPLPFRGGTAAYRLLLDEAEANPLVLGIIIEPERMQPNQVLITLNMAG